MQQTLKIQNSEYLPTRVKIERIQENVKEDADLLNSLQPLNANQNSSVGHIETIDELSSLQPDSSNAVGGEVFLKLDEETALDERVLSVTAALRNKKQQDHPQVLSLASAENTHVLGYSSQSVSFSYLPLATGPVEQTFLVTYFDVLEESMHGGGTKSERLVVRGTGKQSAIFMDEEIVCFNDTFLDKVYRRGFTIKNRGAVTIRVDFKMDSQLIADSHIVEFSPALLFVQAGGTSKAHIKFTPTASNMRKTESFTCPIKDSSNGLLLKLPIRIQVEINCICIIM